MIATRHLAAFALVPALLSGCVTASTTTRTWGADGYQAAEPRARYGRVEQVREVVHRMEGNPAAGAVAGGLIGALVGSSIGGHGHYDRRGRYRHHGSGAGAVVGAIGGAMVGAAASQGSAEERRYEVTIRYEDGGVETYVYPNASPFRVGDEVALTARGLERW
jgi:outer membrane lipoprotein SlyB